MLADTLFVGFAIARCTRVGQCPMSAVYPSSKRAWSSDGENVNQGALDFLVILIILQKKSI